MHPVSRRPLNRGLPGRIQPGLESGIPGSIEGREPSLAQAVCGDDVTEMQLDRRDRND